MGNVISGDLISQLGGQMEQDTQLVDSGNVDDPVADIDDVADVSGNQPGLADRDRIADGKIRLLGF